MSPQTATLKITGLLFETLQALDVKAQQSGKSVEEYARELIEEDVATPGPTFDEILAPIRQEVAESGITDDELDELFMQARRDWRAQMEKLAAEVGAAWQSELSAVEVLAEMRR